MNKLSELLKSFSQKNREFRSRFQDFSLLAKNESRQFELSWKDRLPCLKDNLTKSPFDPHYIYHTAWAIQRVREIAPKEHIDIGSFLYFATLLSASIPTAFYDYRPVDIKLNNYRTGKADLLNLPFPSDSIMSLSCLHVIEHIELGRYGDPLDYNGDDTAMTELERVLSPGGNLLFVVPLGRPRIQFNAHRIYSFDQIKESFCALILKEFSLIPDNAIETGILSPGDPAMANQQHYACGCFWFQKSQ